MDFDELTLECAEKIRAGVFELGRVNDLSQVQIMLISCSICALLVASCTNGSTRCNDEAMEAMIDTIEEAARLILERM